MIQLTKYSHSAGCGCKIAPVVLEQILHGHKTGNDQVFASLLVGNQSNDDAAVWDLHNGTALISTVDFFMPIVDDAFDFGRIAAANAISDVYAMGGKPLFANALLGWPVDTLPLELASRVIEGAKVVCLQAGIPLAGGHSIDSKEPIFGLAVNGIVAVDRIKRNNTAKAGDVLFLTKPIGTGIVATALKRGKASDEDKEGVIASMCQLNQVGEKLSSLSGVHAMTDVTGFGLAGHLIELCEGSGVSAELQMSAIPVFPFIDHYLIKNYIPDGTYRNWNAVESKVTGFNDIRSFQLLNDPQTSGGLLVAVDPSAIAEVQAIMKENQITGSLDPIGVLHESSEFVVSLRL